MRTSASDPILICETDSGEIAGTLGITFCPGKKDSHSPGGGWDRDLDADLDAVAAWGASAVITLLEDDEMRLLQVEGLGKGVENRGMRWFHLPIPDVSIPGEAFESRWRQAREPVLDALRAGQKVLVHCRGGLGRAGLVSALILVGLDTGPRDAIRAVRRARLGAIETREQERYVLEAGHGGQ